MNRTPCSALAAFAAAMLLVLTAPLGDASAGAFAKNPGAMPSASAGAGAAPAARPAEPPPFARVFLALRGCTSCSHCRSTIRQMVKGSAKGGEARVDGGTIEVRYAKPRPVPLREVVRALAENRLHDLNLVDVLFEAKGTLVTEPDGSARFTLAETGQVFRLTMAPHVERPVDGRPVRVTAVVEGWRAKGELSLLAREIKPEV